MNEWPELYARVEPLPLPWQGELFVHCRAPLPETANIPNYWIVARLHPDRRAYELLLVEAYGRIVERCTSRFTTFDKAAQAALICSEKLGADWVSMQ